MRLMRVLGLAAVSVLAWITVAFAHDTYLLPERQWRSDQTMIVLLTSGEAFPKLDFGPKAARVAATVANGPDAGAGLAVAREGAKALQLRLRTKQAGAYAAGLALGPRDIELTPATVGHYFEEADPPQSVRDAYAALPEPRQWRETYEKFAKTFVCVKRCGDMAAFAEETGLTAEFVAVRETLLTKRVAFRLLKDGKPVAGQAVSVTARKGRRTVLRTQANGEIVVPAGLKGPVLLSSVLLTPPVDASARFTSIFVSLTFESQMLGR